MNGVYNPGLVILSIVIAVVASYIALDLANSVAVARGGARKALLAGGAVALGTGIWSMHFVGMLAFRVPGVRIAYNVPLLLLSGVIAIGASALALVVVSRAEIAIPTQAAAALAMGAAIAGMHYTGIWSMRGGSVHGWNPALVTASIAIAVGASWVALWLAMRFRTDPSPRGRWLRLGGSAMMGGAIAGMHYTAMAGAHFGSGGSEVVIRARDVLATGGVVVAVTATTTVILTISVLGSIMSRELARRAVLGREIARLYTEARMREEQYRLLFDTNPHPMWVYDPETLAFLAVNDTAIRRYGYSRDEFLAMTVWDLHPTEDHPALAQDAARIGGADAVSLWKHRRKDGSLVDVEVDARSISYAGRDARIALGQDVTERARAVEALRQSEEHFRALIEHADDIITILEPDGTLRYESPSVERVLGYRPEERVGRSPYEHAHPDDQELMREGIAKLLGGARNVVVQLRCRHKDGSWRMLEATASNLIADPAVRGIVVNTRDITHRKVAEERERELIREHSARVAAEEAKQAITEIFESITDAFLAFDHDWRVTFINEKAEALLGAPRAEVAGANVWELYPELAKRPLAIELQRAMTDRIALDIDSPSERTPGAWLRIHIAPTRDGAVVYVRDITRRKQAEDALREERRRLAEAQRVARVGSWEWDLKTGEVKWSDEHFLIWGHEPGTFQPTFETSLAAIHPDDRPTIDAATRTVLRDKLPFDHEFRIVRPDGEVRVLHSRGEVLTSARGEPVRIIGTDQDVTDWKRQEDKLHRMAMALDASMDGISAVSASGVFEYVNQAKARTFGYDNPEELVGRSWRVTYPPDEVERLEEEVLPLFELMGQWRGEIRGMRKDGSTFPAAVSMTRVDGDGWIAVDWDDTERREAEDELRRRSEMVRLLQVAATAANESVMLQQALHTVVRRVCEFTHMAAGHAYLVDAGHGELVPTNIWCCEASPRCAPLRDTTRRARFRSGEDLAGLVLAKREPVWMDDVTRDPDFSRGEEARTAGLCTGLAFPVLAGSEVVAVMEFFSNDPIPVKGLLLDTLFNVGTQLGRVAERNRAEADLRAARAEAERANRAKSEFLSRMSHELRTPLNAILGFGQLLETELPRDEDRESVELILKAGRHLLELINEMLDLARIEAGEMSLSLETVCVHDVVRQSLDMVRPMASHQGIVLDARDALASRVHVTADPQRLKQVLLNLLSNAIKYNRPLGSVTVYCESTGAGAVRIVVRDTGNGIPADRLNRLFIPFERLGAEQDEVEGTGLGLALSRGLMEAMGGCLGVESREGEGSRFWAELPTTGEAAGVAPAGVEDDVEGSTSSHRVLVIEDNPANVKLMERIFRRRPTVQLLVAMQGGLGLDLAREHRPSLILLDLNLPDLSGREVLRRLRGDPELRHIPVVMVSGDAMPEQVERLTAEGSQGYITKPFNLTEVLRLVDDTLRRVDAGSA